MLNKIFLVCFLLLLSGCCDIAYDGTHKVIVSGKYHCDAYTYTEETSNSRISTTQNEEFYRINIKDNDHEEGQLKVDKKMFDNVDVGDCITVVTRNGIPSISEWDVKYEKDSDSSR